MSQDRARKLLFALGKDVERARVAAFKKSTHLSVRDSAAEMRRYQAEALFRFSDKLSPCDEEAPELLFDRLLLTTSTCYRSTRGFVSKLSLQLTPEVRSGERGLKSFDIHDGRVVYSPIQSELRWLTRPTKDVGQRERFQALLAYNLPIYHDLNHLVISRLAFPRRPKRPDSRAIAHYFSWIEALVILRDLEMAIELGPLSSVFYENRVLYRSMKRSLPDSIKPDFEFFRTAFLYVYYEIARAASAERVSHFIRKQGLIPYPSVFGTNRLFIEDLSPRWISNYVSRYGRRFHPRGRKPSIPSLGFCFDLKTPEELARDQAQLGALFVWYRKVFGPCLDWDQK